jgi:hypothetical protein
MGGASYDRSVYSSGNSYSSSGFSYSKTAARELNDSELNTDLFPKGRELTCRAANGIVLVLDHTGSMGDAAKTIYDKMPMCYGQIEQQGYLKDFAVSFAAVGDVNSDEAPLQVCDFAKGKELDKWLKKIFLEGNGGGQTMESYELMALYYLRHANFIHPKAGKPFLFFIGDEAFYDRVKKGQAKQHLGDDLSADELASKKIFEDLREKYHVFMLHVPYSSRAQSGAKAGVVVSSEPETDRRIAAKWKEIFREDFLVVKEPKAIVDVILGCIALVGETRSLNGYLDDMRGRQQTEDRVATVEEALKAKSTALAKVERGDALALKDQGLQRGRRSKRV